MRSMLSLRSKQSAASEIKQSHIWSSYSKERIALGSSQSRFANLEAQSIGTYAMHDVDESEFGSQLPKGDIHVTDRITQHSDHL